MHLLEITTYGCHKTHFNTDGGLLVDPRCAAVGDVSPGQAHSPPAAEPQQHLTTRRRPNKPDLTFGAY